MLFATRSIILLTFLEFSKAVISEKFRVCKRSDPNLNVCLKTAIQNALPLLGIGFPDYGFPSIEPLRVEEADIAPAPPMNFSKKYKNIELYNHSKTEIKDVRLELNKMDFSLYIKGYNPEVLLMADYEFLNLFLDGVDISSKGKATYHQVGYDVNLTMKGEMLKKNGEDYLVVKTADVVMGAESVNTTYKSKNPELEELINSFFITLFPLVKHEYEIIYANAYKSLTNLIFSFVPYNRLFPL